MLGNCIKKRLLIIALAACCACGEGMSSLFAKEYLFGGKNGWPVFMQQEGITTGKGRYGYDCIELASNSFVFDEYTDLLIDFEDADMPISDGDYIINRNNFQQTNQTKNEKAAGLSRNMGGLSISGRPGSFFGSEGLMGSFSFEFWLCPSIAENGEIVLNWESSRNDDGQLSFQVINGTFDKGHIKWELNNIFDMYLNAAGKNEVELKGSSKIIPDTWSYHVLSFDCETGILEYVVNGITEDITYITTDRKESGDVSLVYLGTPSEVAICPEYTGKLDEFRILRRPYSPPDYQSADNAGGIGHMQYQPSGGRFVTKPIMVSTGSVLNKLEAEMNVPPQTAVCYYVRSGENFYGWTENEPEWKPVESGEELKGITGLYFQVMAELMPDGNGEKTPAITSIALDFTELPEPLPPFVVRAVAGNGSVTVSWNYSVDDTAGGYYLYYGTRPGEYLGRMAIEGQSPINVGNTTSYTVTGLENGKIYYFAVAAWSAYDMRVVGNLSKEVFARPLARLK